MSIAAIGNPSSRIHNLLPSGLTATPWGKLPTAIVAVTVLVAAAAT